MNAHICVCCVHEDETLANQLRDLLASPGIEATVAALPTHADAATSAALLGAVRGSAAVVIVLSEAALASRHLGTVVGMAQAL